MPSPSAQQITVAESHIRIEPSQGWTAVRVSELWQHRDLMFYLVLREIRSATASTNLGFVWLLIQPLSIAIVLTVVLGIFVRVPTGGIPYSLVVLSGLLPWNYVSNSVARASSSMIANSHLLTKVYFPRLIIPAVPVLAGLVDFAVLFVILIALSLLFGVVPAPTWLFLPLPALLVIGVASGAGLWFSALTVRFRDVGNMVPVMLQIGTWASPVLYPSSLVPERWRWLYDLNPMVGIVDSIRWALFAQESFPTRPIVISVIAIVALITTGVVYFRIVEDTAADIV
jgi:lipopolysaccharide transport system permease protein